MKNLKKTASVLSVAVLTGVGLGLVGVRYRDKLGKTVSDFINDKVINK